MCACDSKICKKTVFTVGLIRLIFYFQYEIENLLEINGVGFDKGVVICLWFDTVIYTVEVGVNVCALTLLEHSLLILS